MNPVEDEYSLRIGRVFSISPTTNTVGVKLVSRINHRVNKSGYTVTTRGDYFDEYDETIESVSIQMTTEESFYSDDEETPSNVNAWKMFLPCFTPSQSTDPWYVYVMYKKDSECYIIGISKENKIPVSKFTDRCGRLASLRAVPNYEPYVKITQQDDVGVPTFYFWNIETNSLAATLTDAEHAELSFYQFNSFPTSSAHYSNMEELFGVMPTQNISPAQTRRTEEWLTVGLGSEIGLIESDATHTFSSGQDGFEKYFIPTNALFAIQTITTAQGSEAGFFNISFDYYSSTLNDKNEYTFGTFGTIDTYKNGFFDWYNVALSQDFSLSMGNAEICMLSRIVETTEDNTKLGAEIWTSSPVKTWGVDTSLSEFVAGLPTISNVHGNIISTSVTVVLKEIGIMGDRFGEPYNVSDLFI